MDVHARDQRSSEGARALPQRLAVDRGRDNRNRRFAVASDERFARFDGGVLVARRLRGRGKAEIDNVIGWHYEVIPTDHLSRTEPFCLSMPLTSAYVKQCKYEVIGNVFDNKELLKE